MKFNFLQQKGARGLLITLALDLILFGFTDPANVSPVWLMAGFVLAVATIYWFFRLGTAFLGVYFRAVRNNRRQLTRLLTVFGAIVLGMQSMGQLSLRDVLVLAPLVIVGYFYLHYGKRSPKAN